MPKRTDLKSILIIGSGPIVIGQACEFDYSGAQAIKALKEEGYRVILVNSNPATIMTDPDFADAVYLEPITPEFVKKVIAKERPCAVLPTMGGQTALNIAIALDEEGVFEKYGCELIGAKIPSIKMAEDRKLFRDAMDDIGLESAKSFVVNSVNEARELVDQIGYPMVLRPSRTLGGTGGGIVRNEHELQAKVHMALAASPNHEVLIEESLLGWKEIELEVMRDLKDNVVIICGIENLDPMGVHTGDSITVAPVQTLTDKEYQVLRDAAIKVIRKIGVDTGGSNVQFAINPENGRVIIIEMNPRVSRSSALASKATGFPIAKIAAKLAVGYSLDEIPNDITKETPASFEPAIDYVVVKIPRFNFEKFPLAEAVLGTQMKSVGEIMAFGSSMQEALQKALCSMEINSAGFDREKLVAGLSKQDILLKTAIPAPDRIYYLAEALRAGGEIAEIYKMSAVDPWFLNQIKEIIDSEKSLTDQKLESLSAARLWSLKQQGFSDERLAKLLKTSEATVRNYRISLAVKPNYKAVDTCAAEFKANTPYLYSSYEQNEDAPPSKNKKILILGSGPNRIGQGIEFDYCCVHAVQALRGAGYETIMLNCNPETVSTDYDTANRLYFEPLTLESVLNVIDREKPFGVIVQFGGQTPLKLAKDLKNAGVNIIGTSVESIELAEDRELFSSLITKLNLKQPEFATVRSLDEALIAAERISYPLMIRPSFVLGGRAMRVVFTDQDLIHYMNESVEVSEKRPVLIDRYLHNAIEVDVDLVSDGKEVIIAGIMEHIERAGIHSGDSSSCLPPPTLKPEIIQELKSFATALAKELKVIGLMNAQFAVTKEEEIFIIEANPRASRTVPFVSKATGTPWAKVAALTMVNKSLSEQKIVEPLHDTYFAVKASVFPFSKFPGVDTILGPEMKSTGEVMGIDRSFPAAFAKAQVAVGNILPIKGNAFLSLKNADKPEAQNLIRFLRDINFKIFATSGTATYLKSVGLEVESINKVREGSPHIVEALESGIIDLVINTPEGPAPLLDSRSIRLVANEQGVPTFTTIAAAEAALQSIKSLQDDQNVEVRAIKSYYAE